MKKAAATSSNKRRKGLAILIILDIGGEV